MTEKPRYSSRLAAQDSLHLKMAYVKMHDTLNELERVYAKDNVIVHMVRTLGAMEDTLYEYATPIKRR